MLTKRNLEKLANASLGTEEEWETRNTSKAFMKGLELAKRDTILKR